MTAATDRTRRPFVIEEAVAILAGMAGGFESDTETWNSPLYCASARSGPLQHDEERSVVGRHRIVDDARFDDAPARGGSNKDVIHAQSGPATRPFGAFIHFLKGHEVRVHAGHHACEARQIEAAVRALTMMNVVGQHAESEGTGNPGSKPSAAGRRRGCGS